MTSAKNVAAEAQVADEAPARETELTLNEWCLRKSMARKEVEMIGAFEAHHRNRTPKATSSEFDSLFEAFKVMPA